MGAKTPYALLSFRGESTTTKEREEKMEIKIRNVDPIAVKKIDELAKKKKMSRQEFLKGQLETLTLFQAKTDREIELENLVRFNIQTVEKCTEVMETMNQFIKELMEEDEG